MHFGDSFVNAGLQQALRPRFRQMNTRYLSFGVTKAWLSTWAYNGELDNLYWSFRPSLFLITLGANDLLFKPAHKRAYLVHEIVRRLHGTPCVWISVPLWQGAPSEFVDMIRQESAPCRHFDSSLIAGKITRQEDGRHPDNAGGALWADAFWQWLMNEREPTNGFWTLKPAPAEEHAPRPDTSAAPAHSNALPPDNLP